MAPSFRQHSYLARTGVFRDPKKGLEYLLPEKAKNIETLHTLTQPGNIAIRGGGKLACHLGDVGATQDILYTHVRRTIEFRAHESTLNPDAVQSWIEFCVQLVEFAYDVQDDVLHPFLRKHVEETRG
jgi:hypothetical protein